MLAVSPQDISFVTNVTNITVPVYGLGYNTISGARRLQSLSFDQTVDESPQAADLQPQARSLLQDVSSQPIYNIALTVSKCNGAVPVTDAQATAQLSGAILPVGTQITLTQQTPGSNVYSADVNLDSLSPDLGYEVTATVSFCERNQLAIIAACTAGSASGQSFANTTYLQDACASLLTSGQINSLADAPLEVVTSCTIAAWQLSNIVCKSVSTFTCPGVAQVRSWLLISSCLVDQPRRCICRIHVQGEIAHCASTHVHSWLHGQCNATLIGTPWCCASSIRLL